MSFELGLKIMLALYVIVALAMIAMAAGGIVAVTRTAR